MSKTAIFFGSSTGNTSSVAKIIAQKLQSNNIVLADIAKTKIEDFEQYSNLILGASTWGYGDLQDDWEIFLPKLKEANLKDKTIALFGLGDGESYPDTFVDAIGIIYDAIEKSGCKIVGQTQIEGYNFSESKAIVDGKFIGLAIDEDNESNLTEIRIDQWVANIKQQFNI